MKKNHISLSLKLKFFFDGFTVRNITAKDMDNFFYVYEDYFIVEKKCEHGLGVIHKDGRVIIPYGANKLLTATEDTIMVFNEDSLIMKSKSLVNGEDIYSVYSYSDKDAFYETLYEYCKDTDAFYDKLNLCFVKDSSKRWRISSRYGKEIATKIISYEIIESCDNRPLYVALRFEDHLGILLPDQSIVSFDFIESLFDDHEDENVSFTPLVLTKENPKDPNDVKEFFLGTKNSESAFDISYKEIINCSDCIHYIAKTEDDRYVFLDDSGLILANKSFYEVKQFISNRAFVKSAKDSYYHMIDENGREIKNENLKIFRVVENLEKIKYGNFMMTLAVVETKEHGLIYVDKELHPYFLRKS